VIDIPVARYQVSEHRTSQTRCASGQVHQSGFPVKVSEPVQYGPNVQALAVHLTHGQLLPMAHSAQLISKMYGLSVSPGTIHAWADQAAQMLQPEVAHIAQLLMKLPLVHADEPGLGVGARLYWLHTVASPQLTWFAAHAQRGMLLGLIGAAGHDCWGLYWKLLCAHGLCNTRLLRELTFQHDTNRQR
jgi:transposase